MFFFNNIYDKASCDILSSSFFCDGCDILSLFHNNYKQWLLKHYKNKIKMMILVLISPQKKSKLLVTLY